MFPDSSDHYMIALASGNIFSTTNNGTTWTPVFDTYGSYSIGWIAIDPKNPSIVWVGTGENNNQRVLLMPERALRLNGPSLEIVSRCDGQHIVQQIILDLQKIYSKAQPKKI